MTRARLARAVALVLLALPLGGVACVHLAPDATTRTFLGLERWRSGLERREILLDDSLRVVYLEGGRGTPLLLIHGFGADKDNFTRVARFLTPHYRVLIPDLLGFAESAKPEGADYSAMGQAERLRRFVAAVGARDPLHVGGSSMGGMIALAWAAAHPGEVASLWLLAPAGLWEAPPSEAMEYWTRTDTNPLLVREPEDLVRMIPWIMADPPFVPKAMLRAMAKPRVAHAALEERILEGLLADTLERRIAGVAAPALVVWGDADRVLHPATAPHLAALLARAQVVLMPGIGHAPMIERPRESAEDYRRFREGLGKP